MGRVVLCALVLVVAVGAATEARGAQPAPFGWENRKQVRVAAEWEPATGVLIGWPFKIPRGFIAELAKDVDLYVTVANNAGRRRAYRVLKDLDIDPGRVHFVVTTQSDGYYLPRDWGPFAVFISRGDCKLVDGRYVDYLFAVAGTNKRLESFSQQFGLNYLLDDNAPAAVAKELGWPRTELPVALTGGNLAFDGLGTGFSTQIMVDENAAMGVSRDRFLRILETELGVTRFHVVPNFEGEAGGGIQHIDCLLKLIDEEQNAATGPRARNCSAAFSNGSRRPAGRCNGQDRPSRSRFRARS
jgi:agmatine deiminase